MNVKKVLGFRVQVCFFHFGHVFSLITLSINCINIYVALSGEVVALFYVVLKVHV
jgi:hypothetical protein